jgi:hypothetical protein
LNDGSEVRGSVMSRDPARGVVVRLADASIRTIPESQVAYVGLPGTGGCVIDGEEPGSVTVQDETHGRTPFALNNLWPGTYRVKVEFDGGRSTEQELVVHAGHIERVSVPLPESRKVRAINEGGWVVGGGPLLGVSGEHSVAGISGFGGIYRTLSTTLELRLLGELGLVNVEDGWGPELSLVPMLRIKLSALYAMQLGLQLGAATTREYEYDSGGHAAVKGAIGARASLLSLSFGARRELEITLWHSLSYLPAAEYAHFETGLSFGYVLLP